MKKTHGIQVIWTLMFGCGLSQGILGCSRSLDENGSFTLEKGVVLQEARSCNADQEPQETALAMKKVSNGYQIVVSAFFTCGADIQKPYLTITKTHKATLVIQQIEGNQIFKSSCECSRTLVITLSKRLEQGDILYILRDSEVLGHFVMP
jgi:hypothetical protein